MRLFIHEGDTPCVIFGPGDVKVAHSADEHVPLAEVEACARVLAAWVVEELSRPRDRASARRGSSIGVRATSASRQSAFASRICSGFRARTSSSSGESATTATQRARDVATLRRWRS